MNRMMPSKVVQEHAHIIIKLYSLSLELILKLHIKLQPNNNNDNADLCILIKNAEVRLFFLLCHESKNL